MEFAESNLFLFLNLKPTPCGILDVKKSNPNNKDDFNYSSDENRGNAAQAE
jgi:hypothetical protein